MQQGQHMQGKSDELVRTELMIAYVLRYGVLLCLFVIGVGLAGKMLLPSTGTANEAVIAALTSGQSPAYQPPTTVAAVWEGVSHFRADYVIAGGLMLLIALPIVRVAFTTLVFFHEKDWAFFVITLVVLTVLLSGIILGRAL